jgi:hypothetical protein
MITKLSTAFKGWLRGVPLSHELQRLAQKAGRAPDSPFKRFDHLCFLLTLAQQQGFVRRSVFAVIGLNKLLEFESAVQKTRFTELYDLYLMVSRWRRFGGALELIFEFSKTPEFLRALHEHCPRLETPLRCNS